MMRSNYSLLSIMVFSSISSIAYASEFSEVALPSHFYLQQENQNGLCLQPRSSLNVASRLSLNSCDTEDQTSGANQVFMFDTDTGNIRLQQDANICLGVNATAQGADLMLQLCESNQPMQSFVYTTQHQVQINGKPDFCLSSGRQNHPTERAELWRCDGSEDQVWLSQKDEKLLSKIDFSTLPIEFTFDIDTDLDGVSEAVPYWQTDIYAFNAFNFALQAYSGMNQDRLDALEVVLPRIQRIMRTPEFKTLLLSNQQIIDKGLVKPIEVWRDIQGQSKPMYIRGVVRNGSTGAANNTYISLSLGRYQILIDGAESNYENVKTAVGTLTHEYTHVTGYAHDTKVPYAMTYKFGGIYSQKNWGYSTVELSSYPGVIDNLILQQMAIPDGSETEKFSLRAK
ncbi:RICIN domain-containing protein [Vibrio cortegadensis]|uniref:RICIN domain-containing protein n=2 Tax=Vibrio cortegadensis TaxID=1328770 RepID=UPI0021C2D232|nr:RICIN domain-containing protein [Vibrio cortegadensis]